MRILVACEESQRVTIAFRNLGHEAYSCDLMDCSGGKPEWHIKGDVLEQLDNGWDMMLAFPPCTYLSNAGISWFNENKYGESARERKQLRTKAMEFVLNLYNSKIPKIAIENPVGWLNSHWRKPDQIVQPYHFGDADSKRTCLWLKNLPPLVPTKIVTPRIYGYYKKGRHVGKPIYRSDYCPPSVDRSIIRSKTFPGIALAMANQWG